MGDNSNVGGGSTRQLLKWQDGYYDAKVHSSKQFTYVRTYIENNPVKRGLVQSPEQWEWSSAHSQYTDILISP